MKNLRATICEIRSRSRPVGVRLSIVILVGLCLPSAVVSQNSTSGQNSDVSVWVNPGSDPAELVRAGTYVYFTADDGVHGRELWRTDATPAGTVLVRDIWDGPHGSDPVSLTAVGDSVFFCASSPTRANPTALWVSQGTVETTRAVESSGSRIELDRQSSHRALGFADSTYYFAGPQETPHNSWVWTCDASGQRAASFPIPANSMGPIRVRQILAAENRVFIWGSYDAWLENTQPTEMIWAWDTSTSKMGEANLGSNVVSEILGAIGNRILIRIRDPGSEYGNELWVSDGTQDGTHMLVDINPGRHDGIPVPFDRVSTGDLLFFRADDGKTGSELWISDGTAGGTRLVKDINPGPENSNPGIFAATERFVFFQSNDGVSGGELWVTDGTSDGTRLVRDIYPGVSGSKPFELQEAGDYMYFTGEDPAHGGELWVSDGSGDGTRLVKDIVAGPEGSWPRHKEPLGDKLIFSANDGVHGIEIWVTDGSKEGTFQLRDINAPRGPNPSSDPQQLTAVKNLVFFVINDATHGAELWRSDGSNGGTFLVKDIFPGPPSSRPSELTEFDGRLFFQAEDGTNGLELWVSDGSEHGTYMFADIDQGAPSSSPHDFVLGSPDVLVFAAQREEFGTALFTLARGGTMPVALRGITEDPRGYDPAHLTPGYIEGVGRCVYFVADDRVRGRELWFTDMQNPPVLIEDILSNREAGSNPDQMTVSEHSLYFSAEDGLHGRELFKTEGNSESTVLVQDIRADSDAE